MQRNIGCWGILFSTPYCCVPPLYINMRPHPKSSAKSPSVSNLGSKDAAFKLMGKGNRNSLTSSRALRSSRVRWQWAAATASEGLHMQWHRTPGAPLRRLPGRGSPPSSCTAGQQLPSLQRQNDSSTNPMQCKMHKDFAAKPNANLHYTSNPVKAYFFIFPSARSQPVSQPKHAKMLIPWDNIQISPPWRLHHLSAFWTTLLPYRPNRVSIANTELK